MSRILLHLVCFLFLTTLIPKPSWGQVIYSYANDKQFKIVVSNADLAKAPKWKADDENPPLSPRKAVKAANVVRERLVKDDAEWKWGPLHEIELMPLDDQEKEWVWVVFYQPINLKKVDGRGVLPYLRLVVLMDGTVPEPVVKKME